MNLKLAAAWRTWQEYVALRRECRDRLRVGACRLPLLLPNPRPTQVPLLSSLCSKQSGVAWRLSYPASPPLRCILQAAACHWANGVLFSALRTWRAHAALSAQLRGFALRRQAAALGGALSEWRQWVAGR